MIAPLRIVNARMLRHELHDATQSAIATMTVLVTGAAGFIGLAVTEHLLARGDDVVTADLVDLPARARAAFSRATGRLVATARLDVTDAGAYTALVAAHRPRAIVHLAALTPLGAVSPALAIRTAEVNILGALHAVAAAANAATPFLLHASSGAVFGAASRDAAVLDAKIRPAPVTAYGIAKFAAEAMVPGVAAEAGVAAAVVRLSTAFGRWERATEARPVASPIVRITEAALAGAPVVIADDSSRDFIYAADVATGLASVVDHARAVRDPFHLSIDAAWSLADWCGALAARIPGFTWRLDPSDPAGLSAANARAPLDTGALAALTGFRARFGMEAAMDDYLAWARGGW